MKKRSFTLLMSALTISATLIGTSPVAAKTDTDTATEETTDKEETTAKDADSENTENKETDASKSDTLEDGTYTAEFDTDSGMFHVNEANDGKGTLTVKDGKMTIHVSLASKKIVNLFVGKAEDAQKDGAEVLEPTTDTVTYSDGMSEEVYGFDIPVPAIDEEFDVALIGTKGKWYDHKVSVKNPVKSDELADAAGRRCGADLRGPAVRHGRATGACWAGGAVRGFPIRRNAAARSVRRGAGASTRGRPRRRKRRRRFAAA